MLSFLNPNRSVELLRRNEVPTLIAPICLSMILALRCIVGQPGLLGERAHAQSLPLTLLTLMGGLAIIWNSYKTNGGANGKDFTNRFITLSCVLAPWIYFGSLFLYFAIYFLGLAIAGNTVTAYFGVKGPAQFVFAAFLVLVSMLSLQHYLAKLAGPHAI